MHFELFFRGPSSQTTCIRNRMPPKAFCWSHLGCIRRKFLESCFHVIDDYRLKFFSSAGLPWSPTSNSLIYHECSQLTSTARIKVCLWAMYSWTTSKSTRLLCTMFVSRFVKALWSCSILQLLVTKNDEKFEVEVREISPPPKKSQRKYHILTKPVGCRVTW